MTIMLVGSVGDIKAPEEKTVFIEDLPNQENIMGQFKLDRHDQVHSYSPIHFSWIYS